MIKNLINKLFFSNEIIKPIEDISWDEYQFLLFVHANHYNHPSESLSSVAAKFKGQNNIYRITISSLPEGFVHVKNGFIHRDNAPAIVYSDGYQCWYRHGQLHREDGPACEYIALADSTVFYNNNLLYSRRGPIIEYKNEKETKFWFLNGMRYSQEEWFEQLTSEQKEKAIWNVDSW